jgi:beta-lactamase regulating signal transducer with metallopeptidase domain
MSAIDPLLQQPLAQAIGWALIHFVWQGALIGLAAAVAFLSLQRSAADVRYVVAAIALSLMATMPVVTGVQTYRTVTAVKAAAAAEIAPSRSSPGPVEAGTRVAAASAPAGEIASGVVVSPSWRITRPAPVEPWLPVLVLGWLTGVALLTLRLLGGWMWVQRMKSHGATAAAAELQRIVARLSRRLRISRRVTLLQSSGVDVPTVIGWMKPVILLPVSALAGLSSSQVEAILAHELAHIRRHDYLVNLLQTLLETLLFYHPAVWWLSRRIRAERENCCDDLAVSLCGDPVGYARALADLEERRGTPVHLALAATGGPLLCRIRRLLLAPPATHAGRGPVWLAGAAALVLVTGIAVTAVSREGTAATDMAQQWPAAPPAAPPAPGAGPTFRSGVPVPPSAPSEPVHGSVPPPPDAPDAPAVAPPAPPPPASAPPARVPAEDQSVPSAPAAPAAPAPPAPPAPPEGTVGHISSSGRQSGNYIWSTNGEKLEINYRGDFEFTDDDRDVKRMSPGGQLRISDGGWWRGKSVEFSADASGTISRRYWVGSSERPFDPEGRQWLSVVLPRFIRQSGIGAKARVARFLRNGGPAAVLAEIGRIEGGWAKRIYFTELLNTASLDQATLTRVLEQAGREIESDYELATLLIGSGEKLVASEGSRKAYFEAARTIQSDYELRRVYATALKRGAVSAPILSGMLESSSGIESDYELAELLTQIVKLQPIDGSRGQFFAALATIDSDYEHRRVLSALAQRTDLSTETAAAMLKSVASVSSDYETASFLLQVAKNPVEGALREAFFAAVETVGSGYERGRVLEAVLRRPDLSPDSLLAVLRATRGMSAGYETSQVLQTIARNHTLSPAARDLYVQIAERLNNHEQTQALAALVRNEKKQ